jgi:hypothetical protein
VESADASVPLITSLPPRLYRQDERGEEVGVDYQERCIESWRRAGFEPISVNSASEPYHHSVRMVPVGRDASAVTGRPNVLLADLIAVAAQEAKGGPVVLMNGDLVVRPGTALARNVLELRPGEFIFSRRIDIGRLEQTEGMPFRFGYDFFAGHADDISRLPDGAMVFGAPWWDYYLPLMMFELGCRMYQTEPAVLHLAHGVRWMGAWEELGYRFMAEAQARIPDERLRSRLRDSVNWRSGNLLSDLRYFAWKRLPKNAAMERRRVLHRVAVASMSFLNEVASPRSVMSQP